MHRLAFDWLLTKRTISERLFDSKGIFFLQAKQVEAFAEPEFRF